MSKLLLDRTANGIVTLTINRPDARNALDWETQHLFLDTIKTLVTDSGVRVVIVTGAGEKAFCAGGDLVELAAHPDKTDGERLAAVMGEGLDLLENAPFPSIAAINGHAMGGGAEMALACDLRIMSAAAKFGMVQLGLGLTPGWGAGQRLLRLAGYSRALDMLLRAEPCTAADMLEKGLVNAVVPPDAVLREAMALAERIAGWDSAAVSAVKRILRGGLTMPHDEARAAERATFPGLWAAEAHLKASDEFLNRKNKNQESNG